MVGKERVELFATDFANGELLLFDATLRDQNKPEVKSAGAIGGLDERCTSSCPAASA